METKFKLIVYNTYENRIAICKICLSRIESNLSYTTNEFYKLYDPTYNHTRVWMGCKKCLRGSYYAVATLTSLKSSAYYSNGGNEWYFAIPDPEVNSMKF